MKKKCFKCGLMKELSEFYKHPRMADGHLNKCKECNKKDVHDNYKIKIEDASWVEKERARGREKYHRLGYLNCPSTERRKGLFWITSEYKGLRKWAESRIVLTHMDEIHHWNYNHLKDFFVLSRSAHATIHKKLMVSDVTGLFSTLDGKVLSTKEDHLDFIVSTLQDSGFKKFAVDSYDFTVYKQMFDPTMSQLK